MDVTVTITGGHPEDELGSLRSWLSGDDDLAGKVGPGPDGGQQALAVGLGGQGAATALADSLVAWIRDHTHDAVYQVSRPDGVSVRVSARRVRSAGAAMVRDLIAELCRDGTGPAGDPVADPVADPGAAAAS